MDFTALMDVATAKQKSKDKIKINRYSLDLPAPRKEVKEMARSDVVKKLIQEKENEKKLKEKLQREKEKAKELEEKKKSQFRIPKKKPVEVQTAAEKEKLINSLFEDGDDDDSNTGPDSNGLDVSSRLSPPTGSEHLSLKSSSSHKNSHSSSSSSHKSSSSRDKNKSSHSSSRESSSKSSSSSKSLSGEKKSSSSSSSHSKSSSSSSKHGTKSSESHRSSSSSSKHKSDSHSSSKSSSSSSSKSSSSSSSKSSGSSSSKSTSSLSSKSPPSSNSKPQSPTSAEQQPIALSKHHLKPVAERHATPSSQLSEKEKILAKLAAIKQRTLDAIHKDQQSKGRGRSRTAGSQSSSRSSKAEKEDERVKSKEIVKEVYSSDEDEATKGESVIDLMLNEHQQKLERDKIARMAKQAWDRATKKGGDDDLDRKKMKRVKKSSSSSAFKSTKRSDNNHRNQKRKDHSLSPDPDRRKKVRSADIERKKPKIVRHAGNTAPPPPDFKALLAMAEKKVKDPPKAPGLGKIPKKKKKEEEDRPMTQEEKERKERVKSKEYQHWLKFGGAHPDKGKENNNSNSSSDEEDRYNNDRNRAKYGSGKNGDIISDKKHSKPGDNRNTMLKKSSGHVGSSMRPNKEITVNENVLVCGPVDDEDDSDGDVSHHGALRKHQQQQRDSVNPFDRIYNSVHKKRPSDHLVSKKHQLPEESEEEESDLDGFIDDGDDNENDYSKHIAKIFNYNKKRYVDEDDDVSDMEANFATVMAEEKRSAKIGLMEDLEDMKREEEELKRKAMLKKKMRR